MGAGQGLSVRDRKYLRALAKNKTVAFRAAIERYLKEGSEAAFPLGRSGRPRRPGKDGPFLWGVVTGIMKSQKKTENGACQYLACAKRGGLGDAVAIANESKRKFKTRAAATLLEDFRSAKARYAAEPRFRAEAEFYRDAVVTSYEKNITLSAAAACLSGITD